MENLNIDDRETGHFRIGEYLRDADKRKMFQALDSRFVGIVNSFLTDSTSSSSGNGLERTASKSES
jgi:hypothetical protein